jgi:hypothetical protein
MAKATCKIEDCPDPAAKGRCGWCTRHYRINRVYGDPLGGPYRGRRRTDPRGCSIKDCDDPHYGLGWCLKHWTASKRHGDPEWAPEGTVHRKYDLDDSFFDVIDTEAKAYWLGFINADGCVQAGAVGTAGWQRHSVRVGLKPSDAGHLEKLKADIAAGNPVLTSPKVASITLSSIHLTESLIRLGVTPRKSLTAAPWDGPDDLVRHYWRGMFDGDGTIVKHPGSREKWHLRMLGSEAVVEAFRVWASAACGSAADKYPKGNIWSWTAGGLASPQAVARELYGGSTVYLDRKYELALQLMAAPVIHRSQAGQKCSRDGCDAPAEKKGMCGNDYSNQWRKAKRAARKAAALAGEQAA